MLVTANWLNRNQHHYTSTGMSEIKKLMLQALQEERQFEIKRRCDNIWNMPFFFQIDKAKVLTISYNASIKGIERLYPHVLHNYQKYGLSFDEIFDFQYLYFDKKWRGHYNRLFKHLGITEQEIAHIDFSIYPYRELKDYFACRNIDKTNRYSFEAVALLERQLKYILVDGSKNKDIVEKHLAGDYLFEKSKKLHKNSGANLHELLMYRHKTKDIALVYFGAQLYGATAVSNDCIDEIADFIK